MVVYNNRGEVYADIGDFDAAIADYSKVIALSPEDTLMPITTVAMLTLRKIILTQRLQTIMQSDRVGTLNTSSAYNNRGVAYADNKSDFDAAIADYSKAIELSPEDTLMPITTVVLLMRIIKAILTQRLQTITKR